MRALDAIAVVGASLSGLRTMEALRREGFRGRLIAIGDEDERPYDRPPLSKQYLKGDWDRDKIALRMQSPEDPAIEWKLGWRATALDAARRRLQLENRDGESETLDCDGLVIATGAHARRLPMDRELAGVHVLRTLADADGLREELARNPKVVVIGAGFIGMEVAASCRERGLEVTVVEALPTPLVRGLGETLGRHVGAVFRERGVDLRCSAGRASLDGDDRVRAVVLEDGSRIDASVVVVGIGASPATKWLEGSGLAIDEGVVCDETGSTSVEGIVAVGDVARWQDARSGRSVRAEHWTNAVEQSDHAARRLLHGPSVGAYDHVPYVWTDQFDLRIQIAGEVREGDELHVCHGSLEEGRFVALFGREGELAGAVGFRRPRQLLEFRRLIGQRATWDQAIAQAKG